MSSIPKTAPVRIRNMKIPKHIRDLIKSRPHININLGSGDTPRSGFINVDMVDYPGVDVVWDLEAFPWPFPDNCANLLVASQLVEHINPHKGIFIKFMDEAWRVLGPGGQFMIATPYGGSSAYLQDPSHINPCTDMTWAYFDPLDETTGGKLYENYRPKPWKIVANSWYTNGNLEVVLEKRPWDKSYAGPQKTL